MYICVRSLKEDVNRYSILTKTEAFMTLAEMVISCKNQTIRLRTSVRVLIFILASLTILALMSFLFSNNQIMAQSGNLGRQPPPTQQFPPAFAPNNFVKFPRLQIVQRAGPSSNLAKGIGTSTALCHSDEQTLGGGFVERRSASSSPGQSNTQSIDFKVLASFRAAPPTNGWTVRATGSDTSFAALAQCTKIVIQ